MLCKLRDTIHDKRINANARASVKSAFFLLEVFMLDIHCIFWHFSDTAWIRESVDSTRQLLCVAARNVLTHCPLSRCSSIAKWFWTVKVCEYYYEVTASGHFDWHEALKVVLGYWNSLLQDVFYYHNSTMHISPFWNYKALTHPVALLFREAPFWCWSADLLGRDSHRVLFRNLFVNSLGYKLRHGFISTSV